MTRKVIFAQRIQSLATTLASVVDGAADVHSVYFDRGYGSGGANEILDADVESLGITAADVTAFITMAEQLANFANGAAVAPADFDSTLNRLRSDL